MAKGSGLILLKKDSNLLPGKDHEILEGLISIIVHILRWPRSHNLESYRSKSYSKTFFSRKESRTFVTTRKV